MLKTDALKTFNHAVYQAKSDFLKALGAGPGVEYVSKFSESETVEGPGKWCMFCGIVTLKPIDNEHCSVTMQGKMSAGVYADRVEVTAEGSVRLNDKPVVTKLPIFNHSCDLFAFWPDGSNKVTVHRWVRKVKK